MHSSESGQHWAIVISTLALLATAVAAGFDSETESERDKHTQLAAELRAAGFVVTTEPVPSGREQGNSARPNSAGWERIIGISDIVAPSGFRKPPPPPVPTRQQLRDIARLKSIRTLTLIYTPFPTAELCDSGAWRNLERVSLRVEPGARRGIAALVALPRLNYLSITGPLSDQDAVPLERAIKVAHLILRDTKITDSTIHSLSRTSLARSVVTLAVAGTQITDVGLKSISKWSAITGVHLDRCPRITDAGIAELRRTTQLIELNIEENRQLTSKAIEPLMGNPDLRSILIHRTSISKSYVVAMLPHFSRQDIIIDPVSDWLLQRDTK